MIWPPGGVWPHLGTLLGVPARGGRPCYWPLVRGGQPCQQIARNARDGPHNGGFSRLKCQQKRDERLWPGARAWSVLAHASVVTVILTSSLLQGATSGWPETRRAEPGCPWAVLASAGCFTLSVPQCPPLQNGCKTRPDP